MNTVPVKMHAIPSSNYACVVVDDGKSSKNKLRRRRRGFDNVRSRQFLSAPKASNGGDLEPPTRKRGSNGSY